MNSFSDLYVLGWMERACFILCTIGYEMYHANTHIVDITFNNNNNLY